MPYIPMSKGRGFTARSGNRLATTSAQYQSLRKPTQYLLLALLRRKTLPSRKNNRITRAFLREARAIHGLMHRADVALLFASNRIPWVLSVFPVCGFYPYSFPSKIRQRYAFPSIGGCGVAHPPFFSSAKCKYCVKYAGHFLYRIRNKAQVNSSPKNEV